MIRRVCVCVQIGLGFEGAFSSERPLGWTFALRQGIELTSQRRRGIERERERERKQLLWERVHSPLWSTMQNDLTKAVILMTRCSYYGADSILAIHFAF